MGNQSDMSTIYPDTLLMVQHAITTMILDAIQFYPQGVRTAGGESHGLIFGNIVEGVMECDYIFPVGNVTERKPDEIRNNPKVDEAIKNAKHILFTSRCCGDYHSHPYKLFFKGAANPSNGDINYASWLKQPYMMIIALSRKALLEKSLSIEYKYDNKREYSHLRNKDLHDYPATKEFEEEISYLHGRFKKYEFEIRAFKLKDKNLESINLLSSEAEMLMELIKNDIAVEKLDPQTTYALRKIEYDYRVMNGLNDTKKEKAKQNLEYHIKRIRES